MNSEIKTPTGHDMGKTSVPRSLELIMSEEEVIKAALGMLNGRPDVDRRESMLKSSDAYGRELYGQGVSLLRTNVLDAGDETHGREQFIQLCTNSLESIISNAGYLHYTKSSIERVRFFFEQTRLRRHIGALAIGGATSGVTTGIFSLVDKIPKMHDLYSAATGLAVAGMFFKVMGPKAIIRKIIQLPADRMSDRARASLEKNNPNSTQDIHQRVKEIIRVTQNKEIGRRKSYELITQELYMSEVRSDLRNVLGPLSLVDLTDQEKATKLAVSEVVDWLNAFYGVKKADLSKKESGILELSFKYQRPIPWLGSTVSITE